MKWSLTELRKNHRNDPLQFEETLDLKADLMERYGEEVLDLSPVKVQGMVSVVNGDVAVDARVKADLTVPSSRSLTPVDLPVDFRMTEYYVSDAAATQRFEKADVVMVVPDDLIDFDKAVGDNIILQIPMHILSDAEQQGAAMPEGQDWQVVSEADLDKVEAENQSVDPRLAKLKDFFPDQDDK
ncbi:DNA-binding protein [Lactobacillus sp. PFC-70]|uniref:YceD family protein n=1 Tax=Levilactobacillus namurensis TaxID=380393 RepID=UPI000D317843|nr:YceD family protein [Levilactobacillus namurensis]MCW3777639.1 YceD family protein [Levilactobacillus namurensis]PTM22529.1 DNA-binding protein [Lactobacillus sp. PFC-70]WNN66545.1 YceD family protein [Levilactobacillus namurensis]